MLFIVASPDGTPRLVQGEITVLRLIPANRILPSGEVKESIDWRPEPEDESPRSEVRADFSGWDSLTMALLA